MLIASVIGTAVSAMGSIVAGQQQAAIANQQAQIADRNAKIATEAAQEEVTNAREEALQRYRKIAQIKSEQRAGAAGNGVVVDFGTAGDMVADTDMLGREDVANIFKGGERRRYEREVGAWNSRAEAAGLRAQASAAKVNSYFNAGSTILGGVQQFGKLKKGMG
jgi:hypothetical protein